MSFYEAIIQDPNGWAGTVDGRLGRVVGRQVGAFWRLWAFGGDEIKDHREASRLIRFSGWQTLSDLGWKSGDDARSPEPSPTHETWRDRPALL